MPTEPTSAGRQLRVFLCHSSGDKPLVRQLYARLRKAGFSPWLDEEDLIPGQDWQDEIPSAVRASDAVIVCLSRTSVTKEGFVQKEIKVALDVADEKPDKTIFIIPAPLEEGVDVPGRLTRWQWVNLSSEDGYEKLIHALHTRATSIGVSTHAPRVPVPRPNAENDKMAGRAITVENARLKIRTIEHDYHPGDTDTESNTSMINPKYWGLSLSEPKQWQPILNQKRFASSVRSVAVMPDGRRMISGAGFTLKMWDLDTHSELLALQGHSNDVVCIAVSSDGRWAVSGSEDHTLKVWDLAAGKELHTLKVIEPFRPRNAVVSQDGQFVIAAHGGGASVWDLRTGRLVHHNYKDCASVAITPDGRVLACRRGGRAPIEIWDVNSTESNSNVLLTLLGNADYEAEHVAVSPDGNRAVASCRDKTIKLWDIRPKALDLFKERSPKLILRGHTECINGIALSPEGRRVASASSDFTLKVWDLDAGHPLATIPLECKVLSCAWSIFGTIIAGDSDGKLHIVDFK